MNKQPKRVKDLEIKLHKLQIIIIIMWEKCGWCIKNPIEIRETNTICSVGTTTEVF